MVSGGNAPALVSWDLDSLQPTSHPSPPTTCLDFDGLMLFGGGEDGRVTMYDQNFRPTGTIKAHPGYIRCIHFDMHLFTGAADGVKVWNYPTQEMLRVIKHHDEPPRCLRVRGKVLYVGTEEGGVVKFDLDVGVFEEEGEKKAEEVKEEEDGKREDKGKSEP